MRPGSLVRKRLVSGIADIVRYDAKTQRCCRRIDRSVCVYDRLQGNHDGFKVALRQIWDAD